MSQDYIVGQLEGMEEEGPDDEPPVSDAARMAQFKELLKAALKEA